MAAATKDRADSRSDGDILSYPVAANTTIYKNTFVCCQSGTGYAIPGIDAATTPLFGVSVEQGANNPGAAGAISIRVRKNGVFEFAIAAATQANVGAEVYITDDSTVQLAANVNLLKVGVIVSVVSATLVRVRITGYTK